MKKFAPLIVLALLILISSTIYAQDFAASGDLRIIQYGAFEEGYAELEVTIEAGDMSLLFYVQSEDIEDEIALLAIEDFDGNLFYELDGMDNVVAFGFEPITDRAGGELSVFLPSAPQFDLGPGDYVFYFETLGSPITDSYVMIRSGDPDAAQELDINFWVVSGSSGLDDAATRDSFEAAIRTHMDNLLNPHNLGIGAITFFQASAAQLDEHSQPSITEEDETAIGNICAEMSRTVGVTRTLNVAIIDFFEEEGDTESIAGIANSIGTSGVITEAGSPFSCVVVSWDAYTSDFTKQAANIIHESGHFMSLSHTTEEDGESFDIFEDTLECPLDDFDENGDGAVDDYECAIEGGAKNFMFYTDSDDIDLAPFEMSADQAWTLRRHPLFKPAN